MATIKKGTYRFNDALNFDSLEVRDDLFYGNCHFKLQPFTLEITQEICDIALSEYGVSIPVGSVNVQPYFETISAINNGSFSLLNYESISYIVDNPVYESVVGAYFGAYRIEVYHSETTPRWHEKFPVSSQYIIVTEDCEATDMMGKWFTENAKPVIKAGTYRFNDEIPYSTDYVVEGYLPFTFPFLETYIITCSAIIETSLDSSLKLSYITESISPPTDDFPTPQSVPVYRAGAWEFGQTITVTEDTAVSSEFATWFNDNAVELKAISGAWKFNNEITSIPYERFESSSTPDDREAFLDKYGIDVPHYHVAESGIGATLTRLAPAVVVGDMYVDGVATVFTEELLIGAILDDTNEYVAIPVVPSGVAGYSFDLGTEPQYVPIDTYNWLLDNAKPALKKFTRLYIGNSVASSGGKCFKRLTEQAVQND